MNNEGSQFRAFGKFRLDAEKRVLWFENEPVNLQLKEIELLCVLTESGAGVVTKEELLNRVWADSFVEESNLSRHIYQIRKLFKDLGETDDLIQTVPRRGYRFAGDVREIGNGELIIEKHTHTQTLIEIEEDTTGRNSERGKAVSTSPLSRVAVLALAVLIVSLLGGFAFWSYQSSPATTSEAVIRSIAVLPLRSFDSKNEDDELRMRITDALITKLGNLKEISVRPTNSVLRFANQNGDSIEAGKQLEVDAILDGRVQIEGHRLRVTLQIVLVSNGEQIWSGQFDGKTSEILNLQDEISAQLLPRLSQPAALAKNPTSNAEAYEMYLKGRHLWNRRNTPDIEKAVPYFEQAIALDPNFALAYAGLADAYSQLANHNSLQRFEGYAKAKATAIKALAIDPDLSEGYSALGWVLYKHEWNWAAAETALARSIELNPNNAEAHHWRGLNFLTVGKTQEYFAEMEKARSLAPLTKPIGQNYYRVVLMKEGCAEAFAYLEKLQDLYQSSAAERMLLGASHHSNCEDYDKVIEMTKQISREKLDARTQGFLAVAYAKTGKRQEAIEIIETLRKSDSTIKFRLMPWVHTALGDFGAAFDDLEKGIEARDDSLTNLKYDDFLLPLRSDARFGQLLKRMNLPE